MGIFDEFKRLARPYEDEEEDDYDEFDISPRPVERRERERVERPVRSESAYNSPPLEDERRGNKVVNIRAATQLQVVLVKPERFEDASSIADHLREKRTVVLNLESTNKEIARRLLDFLAGVSYAQEGKIKRVAVSTYIITPYNVDILGDLIDELENNGLYF
ncbi:cell division protein SepF [Pseudoflavonifractor sp. 60]|uniref:cell division protein SepF n=1 Tax=Pseudoflavonifractor sp. 60 TaxID=2304576 RepID=UPI00136B6CAE|nr:cell division protein SepF [Pseudoflavonifractor sp. 60]NBI67095.1 cell division protein SepF [Pseudoflavonifractor sp. 60]